MVEVGVHSGGSMIVADGSHRSEQQRATFQTVIHSLHAHPCVVVIGKRSGPNEVVLRSKARHAVEAIRLKAGCHHLAAGDRSVSS